MSGARLSTFVGNAGSEGWKSYCGTEDNTTDADESVLFAANISIHKLIDTITVVNDESSSW